MDYNYKIPWGFYILNSKEMNKCIANTTKCFRLSMIMLLLFSIRTIGFTQNETEKHRTYLGIEYIQSESQRFLTATLTARIEGERGRKKIGDAEISFHFSSDTAEILLGKVITNGEGSAQITIPQIPAISTNADGEYLFSATFDGNGEFQEVAKEFTIKPLMLDISFVEEDSVKNIVATAYSLDSEGQKIPVEEDVVFYVPRQFSKLKIGEVELQDGTGMIEFPVTLPGDSIGNLTIIASIEESSDFGTVQISRSKDWGQARPIVVVEKRRGLGDTDAPLWMVYTLIILMSTVWFHYMYLLYMLIMIKKKGKAQAIV